MISPPARLPAEVCERIVDFIASGNRDTRHVVKSQRAPRREALLACALTARGWLHRTRYHLYNTITLYNPDELSHFVALLKKFPVVASYVQVLNAFYIRRGDYQTHTIPIYLSTLLPSLREVTFVDSTWFCARPIFFVMASKFLSVTTLCLQGIRFATSRDCTKFIMSFSQLSSLRVSDITCKINRPFALPHSLKKRSMPLLSLDISNPVGSQFDILTCLNLTSSNSKLTSVHMLAEKKWVPDVAVIGDFLFGCVSLRYLKLSMDHDSFSVTALNSMDFSRMKSLHTLELMANAPVPEFPFFVHMLSTIQSQDLHKIDCVMWFKLTDGEVLPLLEGMDWARLDAILKEVVFKTLGQFKIDIYPQCDTVPVDFLTSRLPKLNDRGILYSPHLERTGKRQDKGKQREFAEK